MSMSNTDEIFYETLNLKRPHPGCAFKVFVLPSAAHHKNERMDYFGSLPTFADLVSGEEWQSLSDLADVSLERESYADFSEIDYYAIDQIPNNPLFPIEVETIPTEELSDGSRAHFLPGDVAVSRLWPTIINKKSLIIDKETWGSPEFIRVRPHDINHQKIIFFWLKTATANQYMQWKTRGKSASQKRLDAEDLASMPIPAFTKLELEKINSKIDALLEFVMEIDRGFSGLSQLQGFLLSTYQEPCSVKELSNTISDILEKIAKRPQSQTWLAKANLPNSPWPFISFIGDKEPAQ